MNKNEATELKTEVREFLWSDKEKQEMDRFF